MSISNSSVKKTLRIAFIIEIIAAIFVGLFSDPECTETCLQGWNDFILYILPVICLTIFTYIYIKLNESVAQKTTLSANRRILYIFTPIVLFILLIFGIYILRNT